MFNPSRWLKRTVLAGLAVGLVTGATTGAWTVTGLMAAATAPTLGAAQSFAVLGGSTVTNTGPSTVNGNVGVAPGSAITGFPPGTVTGGGSVHNADAQAQQAQNAVTTAYNALTSQACDSDLTGQDLGGKTLTPGVYCFSSSAQLTGPVTLNAQGSADAVWVFKTGSTLTTASGSSVLLTNGGSACNVFWQIGSSATLGTNTSFAGNILALTSITLTTGADVTGRALARNGAVTMDTNDISIPSCVTAATATATPTASATITATGTAAAATGTPTASNTPGVTVTASGATASPTPPGPSATGTLAAATATTTAQPSASTTAVPSPATPVITTVAGGTVPTATPSASSVGVPTVPPAVPAALPNTGEDGAGTAAQLSLLLGALLLGAGFLGARRLRG